MLFVWREVQSIIGDYIKQMKVTRIMFMIHMFSQERLMIKCMNIAILGLMSYHFLCKSNLRENLEIIVFTNIFLMLFSK